MTTKIEWAEETWNPVVGCTKVSQGCKHCYAKDLHDKRHKAYQSGKAMPEQYAQPFETVQLMPERLEKPLHWKKPRRVFVNSVSDLFHEEVPDEFIDKVFAVMALAPQHEFLVLTKRPKRMREYVGDDRPPLRANARKPQVFAEWQCGVKGRIFDRVVSSEQGRRWRAENPYGDICGEDGLLSWPLPNVWLGVSAEDQATADERIPLLLETPAAVRFVSAEPLLGPVDLRRLKPKWLPEESQPTDPILRLDGLQGLITGMDEYLERDELGNRRGLSWVIVGGESGPGARPCDLEWIRIVVGQCQAARVPVFVKQLGAKPALGEVETGAGTDVFVPDLVKLRDRKGGDMAEWPEDLRVREFPR